MAKLAPLTQSGWDRKLLASRYNDKAARWARARKGLLPPFEFSANPPAVSMSAASTLTSATGGNRSHAATSPLLNYGLDGWALTQTGTGIYGCYPTANVDGTHTRDAALLRIRFQTDAPAFELVLSLLQYAKINMIVEEPDGVRRIQWAYDPTPSNTSSLTAVRYVKYDWGASTGLTYEACASNSGNDNFQTFVSAGTGHAPGDEITLTGGMVVKVVRVSSGAVTDAQIKTAGVYSAVPTSTLTQVSTTGSGTGLSIDPASIEWGARAVERRPRKIELQIQGSVRLYGINIPSNANLLSWPIDPDLPRLLIAGDSQSRGTFLKHGAAHMPSRIARRLGLYDNYAVNANGGTGWDTANGTAPPWSNAYRIADFIAYNPDILLFIGSQNDNSTNVNVTTAVTNTINTLAASLPNCLFVGIGSVLCTNSANIKAGWEAASVYGDRALYVDNVTVPWITGDAASAPGGASDVGNFKMKLTSSGVHLSDAGAEYFAALAAAATLDAVHQMAA